MDNITATEFQIVFYLLCSDCLRIAGPKYVIAKLTRQELEHKLKLLGDSQLNNT